MAKIFSIQNKKGGDGKTQTALNMAYGLSQAGYKTLFVIEDPQANGQKILLKEKEKMTIEAAQLVRQYYDELKNAPDPVRGHQALKSHTNKFVYPVDISDVLKDSKKIYEAIQESVYKNLDVIPASLRLSVTDSEIKATGMNPSGRLRNALKLVEDKYDVIIIDNSPFENALTYNSMCACSKDGDIIIIPTNLSEFSLEGLDGTLDTLFKWLEVESLGYDFKILLTMTKRNNVNREWQKTIRHIFPDRVFEQSIRFQSNPIEKAQHNNKILLEDKLSSVQEDYHLFVEELINKYL